MANDNVKGTVLRKEPSPIAQLNISVRGLVEFVLRHGDIDNRRKSSQGPEVMLEGANIHRMIQKRMGPEYFPEFYLKHVTHKLEYDVVVDGRADGIIIPSEWEPYIKLDTKKADIPGDEGKYLPEVVDDFSPVIIDEIKTTYRELEYIKEPEPVHLAQAKCYAFILTDMYKLPRISVRMTYCNTQTHEVRYFESSYTREEITSFYSDLMEKYIRFAQHEVNWKRERNASIEAISFPYEYREGQKELVAQVFKSIEARQKLYVMAPTGVGKTLANMYPSVKGLAMGRAEKIFYLTAKTITRTVASDCLNLLRQQNLHVKSVMLTAKEKICPLEKTECNPVKCPYAKGHFDRINDAMYDLMKTEDEFSREKIVEYSEKHMVCPFEFSLDMSLFSDVIICDYNYVFDPNVYLRRFFSDGNQGQFLFLIDEAHNLVDRVMSMYSAQIIKEDVLEMKRLVRDVDPRLARALDSCNKSLLALKRDCEDVMVVDEFEGLVMLLTRAVGRIEQFLDDHEHFEESDLLLDFYFNVRHFLNIYENMNEEDYVLYTKIEDNGDFSARLMCANPSKWVDMCTDRAKFTVFFSATLIPLAYYRKMLGADENDPAVYAKSVFDPNKRELLIAKDVTSKYTRRNDAEYARMAEYIGEIVSGKEGNYMVFFPSFAMLDRVYDMYVQRYYKEGQELAVQESNMNERQREEFIEKFSKTGRTLIGFCVLGGIFSEGIDLKKDALIGAIIVGTGLPMVCAERELLKRRYEDTGLDGFAYAYRYPGMNKVLQAAGRVIRTADDRGVVALLDERFLGRDYKALFPREWSNYKACSIMDANEYLEEFWDE